jgi:hypothetical protein
VGNTRHRAILTTCYAAGPAHLRSHPPEAHRYRQSTHGHPGRPGQRPEGSLRDAVSPIAGDAA